MPFKLILNKDGEETIQEHASIEQTFDAAVPWIMKGFTARMMDEEGTVKYTQTLAEGQIATYPGDATQAKVDESQVYGYSPKPWWKLW
jgi:hypothetical protein